MKITKLIYDTSQIHPAGCINEVRNSSALRWLRKSYMLTNITWSLRLCILFN